MQERPAEQVAERLWEIRRRLEGLRNDPSSARLPPTYNFDGDHLVEGIAEPIERLLTAIQAAMAGAAHISPAWTERVVRILAHLRERLISVRDNASNAYGDGHPLGPSLEAAKMSMYRGMCEIWESHEATLAEVACAVEAEATVGLAEARVQRAKNGAKQLTETQLRELEVFGAQFSEMGKRYPGLGCRVLAWQRSHAKRKRDSGQVATDYSGLLPPEYESDPADQIRMWTHEPCGVESLISELDRKHMDQDEVDTYEKECEEQVSWHKVTWLLRRKGETWDKEAALASLATLATRVMQHTRPWYQVPDLAYFDVLRELEVFSEGTWTDQEEEDAADSMDLVKWLWLLFLVNKEQRVCAPLSGGWCYGIYAGSLPMWRKWRWPYAMEIRDVFLESTLLCGLLRQAQAYSESGTGEKARLTGKTVPEPTKAEEAIAKRNAPGQGGEKKRKITLPEANIEVRRLLKETPSWEWKVRALTAAVKKRLGGGSQGLIASCPAWKAYNEKREQLEKAGTIKTVPFTSEMEAVLGVDGDSLPELIAEQEAEDRDDTRKAKLYLSHEKKPKRRES
jgi:hypothetical protein